MANRLTLLLPGTDEENGSGNFFSRMREYAAVVAASPRMSGRDREILNPCEKLRKYGRIPWKLTIHCALAAITTIMVFVWTENDALHIRHSLIHFRRALLGVSGTDKEIQLNTAEDLKQSLDGAVGAFWEMGKTNLTDYSVCKGPLDFEVFKFGKSDTPYSHILLFENTWADDPAYQEITNSVDSNLRSMVIRGVVHDKFEGRFWHQCLRWTLETRFQYGGTGMVVGNVGYQLTECSKEGESNHVIPVIVIVLAIVSAVLVTKAFLKQNDKRKWFVFNMTANLIQVWAAVACMRLGRRMDVDTRFALVGLAAIMAWVSLIRYLRFFHIYYVLVRTLSHAVPQCLRFVTGVAPILIGYALLGTCLFYQSVMFTTIGDSLATLFSLLNGDIIRDSFTELSALMPFWGQMYLYTFMCLFIYVVLHIFISIVEESYFDATQRMRKEDSGTSQDVVSEGPTIFELDESSRGDRRLEEHILARICEDIQALKRDKDFWALARSRIDVNIR